MSSVFKASDVQKGTKLPAFEKRFKLSRNAVLNAAAAGDLEICVRVPDMQPVVLEVRGDSPAAGCVRSALFVVEPQVAGDLLAGDQSYVPIRRFFVPGARNEREEITRAFMPAEELKKPYAFLEVRAEEVIRWAQKIEDEAQERASMECSGPSSTHEEGPMRSDHRTTMLRTVGGLVTAILRREQAKPSSPYLHKSGDPNVSYLADKVAEFSGAKERTVNKHITEALKLLETEAE